MNSFYNNFNLLPDKVETDVNSNFLSKYQNARNLLFTPEKRIKNIIIDKNNYNNYKGKFNIENVIGIQFRSIIFSADNTNMKYFDLILSDFSSLNMIDNVDELNIQERIPVLEIGNQYFSSDYVNNNNMFTPINIDLKDFPFNIRLDSDNNKVYKGNLKLFNNLNPDINIQLHSITLEVTVLTNVKTLNN
jgi:hypothetical protein